MLISLINGKVIKSDNNEIVIKFKNGNKEDSTNKSDFTKEQKSKVKKETLPEFALEMGLAGMGG